MFWRDGGFCFPSQLSRHTQNYRVAAHEALESRRLALFHSMGLAMQGLLPHGQRRTLVGGSDLEGESRAQALPNHSRTFSRSNKPQSVTFLTLAQKKDAAHIVRLVVHERKTW